MGCCCSTSKSVDLPPVPPAPAKRETVLPEFPVASKQPGATVLEVGVTNVALEED